MNEQTESTEPEAVAPKGKKTERLVLYRAEDGSWVETTTYLASSQNAAISAHLDTQDEEVREQERTWVAVPTRSWKPVPVGVETQTKLKFG